MGGRTGNPHLSPAVAGRGQEKAHVQREGQRGWEGDREGGKEGKREGEKGGREAEIILLPVL